MKEDIFLFWDLDPSSRISACSLELHLLKQTQSSDRN